MSENINKLIDIIKNSKHIVFFGGAGVSTASGIPDFRSKDGLYNNKDVQFEKYSAEYLLSHTCLVREPEVFYEFYMQKLDTRTIEPNITHRVLAKMEDAGMLDAIITQNIDGLHQRAGSKKVYEIHGTTLKNYCPKCGKIHSASYIFDSDGLPKCDNCDGIVRPDVTLYEESLPGEAVIKSDDAIRNCDLLIVGGTSLNVYPAASYVRQFSGDNLAVINLQAVDASSYAKNTIVLQEDLSNVFEEIDKALFV